MPAEGKYPNKTEKVSDSPSGNWVDLYAPAALQPYLRLMRIDRPIGTWLLLLPCWWSLALAYASLDQYPDLYLAFLFAVGALVMRGAGCTYNDILDRDIDAGVARTRSRPIPSGQVTLIQAWVFLGVQCLIGLLVLLQFNLFSIILGASSILIVAIYPLMKRLTYWPQFVLGLAFNWGALLGWTSVMGGLTTTAALLYLAGIFWTIGYDTIYAHQDREDDALLGLKSTALKFGSRTKIWLSGFYGMAILCLLGAGYFADMSYIYYGGVSLSALHLVWQINKLDINNAAVCLSLFRSNRDFGLLVLASILLDLAI